jgi:hypothetical protein
VKVKLKVSLVFIAGEFSGPPEPVLVTVCASPSLFVQVTLVPAFTVSEAGEKAKFVMATVVPETGAAGAEAVTDDDMSIPGIDAGPLPMAPG